MSRFILGEEIMNLYRVGLGDVFGRVCHIE